MLSPVVTVLPPAIVATADLLKVKLGELVIVVTALEQAVDGEHEPPGVGGDEEPL